MFYFLLSTKTFSIPCRITSPFDTLFAIQYSSNWVFNSAFILIDSFIELGFSSFGLPVRGLIFLTSLYAVHLLYFMCGTKSRILFKHSLASSVELQHVSASLQIHAFSDSLNCQSARKYHSRPHEQLFVARKWQLYYFHLKDYP